MAELLPQPSPASPTASSSAAAHDDARAFHPGDIVRNFKRQTVTDGSQRYLYRILAFARHTETDEELVVYEALYPPFGTWCRPRAMFESEVDHTKYPAISQRYRFEKVASREL